MQDGKAVLPLGTLTVEETKAPNGYLLDGAYMQAGDKSEQIKGLYVTQITEDGDLAVLTGSNQFSVSDKVIRGGVKIQKRDLETGDTKPKSGAVGKGRYDPADISELVGTDAHHRPLQRKSSAKAA